MWGTIKARISLWGAFWWGRPYDQYKQYRWIANTVFLESSISWELSKCCVPDTLKPLKPCPWQFGQSIPKQDEGMRRTYMDLRFALSLSGNESLQMTNTWRGEDKGPWGCQTLKEWCYESRHLINNYKKNLFRSFTLTPGGQASPLKMVFLCSVKNSKKMKHLTKNLQHLQNTFFKPNPK